MQDCGVPDSPTVPMRTPPPPFRRVEVVQNRALNPRMRRIVLGGPELAGMAQPGPAASVRLVVPWSGDTFEVPEWNGNEFLLSDGRRPALRTFTPVELDPTSSELTIDIVRHHGGAISGWADQAAHGDTAAVSGPGRADSIDESAGRYVLLGDETAIPAIRQLIAAIPATIQIDAHIEIRADGRLELPSHPRLTTTWHDTDPAAAPGNQLREIVTELELDDDSRVWAAGEAAAVQAIRKHLFTERGMARHHTSIRGYWKLRE